jgi:hypothetical protein
MLQAELWLRARRGTTTSAFVPTEATPVAVS